MKALKPLLVLGSAMVLLSSCLGNDRGDTTQTGYLTVSSAVVNGDVNPANQPTKVDLTLKITNTCQSFYGIQAIPSSNAANTFNITVIGIQQGGSSCQPTTATLTHTYQFTPPAAGDYTLNFLNTVDPSTNMPIYTKLNITVPAN